MLGAGRIAGLVACPLALCALTRSFGGADGWRRSTTTATNQPMVLSRVSVRLSVSIHHLHPLTTDTRSQTHPDMECPQNTPHNCDKGYVLRPGLP